MRKSWRKFLALLLAFSMVASFTATGWALETGSSGKGLKKVDPSTLNITRHLSDNSHLSLIYSTFYTNEQERYDIQGQYWLTQTETSENLGVGTYMEHTRNYLTANVQSFKVMLQQKVKKHDLQAGFTYKNQDILILLTI